MPEDDILRITAERRRSCRLLTSIPERGDVISLISAIEVTPANEVSLKAETEMYLPSGNLVAESG